MRLPQAGAKGYFGKFFGTMRVLMNSTATLERHLTKSTEEEEQEFQHSGFRGVDRGPAHLMNELLCVVQPPVDPQEPQIMTIDRGIELTKLEVRSAAPSGACGLCAC